MKVSLSKVKEQVFRGAALLVNNYWTKYEVSFTLDKGDAKAFIHFMFFSPRRDYGSSIISNITLYKQES